VKFVDDVANGLEYLAQSIGEPTVDTLDGAACDIGRRVAQKIEDAMGKAGYDPKKVTCFIWEGVTYYITGDAVDQTLRFIAARSAPGSTVVFDYIPEPAIKGESNFASGCLAEQEAVNAAFLAVFHELVARRSRKGLEVGNGTRVGGQYLQRSAVGHVLQRFLGFEDRKRTVQPFCVEYFVCHGVFLSG